MVKYLRINSSDNVAVAIESLRKGEVVTVGGQVVALVEDIAAGHKFALCDLAAGDHVIKYGYSIGHATSDIVKGGLVNEKNIKTNLDGVLQYKYAPALETLPIADDKRTFMGYRRANGEVGIRNEIWIIPTVGCVNGTVGQLAQMLRSEIQAETLNSSQTTLHNVVNQHITAQVVAGATVRDGFPDAVGGVKCGVDAIAAFPHNYGCSQLGADHENTRKILRDMVLHPNAGGVLVVGLGCENNQLSAFREMLGDVDPARVKFMETQKIKGDELDFGMKLLREIYETVKQDFRAEVPLSELRVGLKCGGSDGFSGITGNPLLGIFSDYLIAQGGTSILTEVPEMFGAETILMNRCQDSLIFNKTVHLINDFKQYFIDNKQPIYENPSPGNKAGGISTLEEKSLGCTQKCGKATVNDVLMYGDRIKEKGLNLLSSPGNDLVAATALAAAGCQMVLFTTGRGTPFGTFVPTMKISTNSALAQSKPGWIDFNAGVIVQDVNLEQAAAEFTDYVIEVASGRAVNNEKSGFREIAIFKTGVTL